MANITAAAVKSLRDRTGQPMMECKRALQDTGGDEDAAVEKMRKEGKRTMETRAGRETSSGRIAVYTDPEKVGAMVELLCESAPVAGSPEFVALANDLVQQLALGPGAATAAELLAQPSPGKGGMTLQEQLDDLSMRIREVFKVGRIERIDSGCGGYAHHTGTSGVLLQVSGGNADLAKDISMHVAAMRPLAASKDELDPTVIQKEREILAAAAKAEGKPEKIIDKMVEGRLRNFFAEQVLAEQPFVKDDSKTVGQIASDAGMKITRFVHWELGKNG